MINLKTDDEIEQMKRSCHLASGVLDMIGEHVRPDVTTLELNDICHRYIVDHGAVPAPLNYKGFPKSICTSLNHVVCHGIPNAKQKLKSGDIINIDVTTIIDGFHGDTSRMYMVGDVSDKAQKLVGAAKKSLELGIQAVEVGGRIGDIGAAIQQYAESEGYSVVREFVGHGIGREFHEPPQILHYGKKGKGVRIQPGMVFTIEPMINEGHWKTKVLRDGWTAVTIDNGLSAQWEHTIAVKSSGEVEVLTSTH